MRATQIALLFLILSAIGCGTCSDMIGGPLDDKVFYRGVRTDIESIQQGGPAMVAFNVADLPFSALADTVLAPFLVPVWLNPADVGYHGIAAEMAKREADARPPENQPAAIPP